MCVAAGSRLILAGTKNGVLRSMGGGTNWVETNNGINVGHTRWMTIHPDNHNFLFLGHVNALIIRPLMKYYLGSLLHLQVEFNISNINTPEEMTDV